MPRGTWIGVASALTILGGVVLIGRLGHNTTPNELDALLRERIPVGSNHQRVEAFLDSVGVEHVNLDQKRRINATWRRTWVGLVGEKSIGVRFYFDDEGLLVRYELEETGSYM